MPAGMGEEERFAAAVEYGTTPASAGWGDDSADSLARELEIVALLRSGGPALGPEPAGRERAKRRLMTAFAQEFGHDLGDNATEATGPLQVLAPVALAEREPARHAEPAPLRRAPHRAGRHSAPEPDLLEEPDAPEADDAPELGNVRRLRAPRTRAPQRRGHHRAAVLGAAAAAALVALAGTSTFASRDALPGDPMYGVKRVAESTGYALTFGEQAKARRHLEQAQRRLDEVEGMVARGQTASASGSASGSAARTSNPELVRSTMQEFDADTSEGSRLLLAGPTPPDTAQVDEVRTWATQQSERLSGIRSTLPAPDRADQSLALLDRLLGETEALQNGACQPGTSGSAAGSATATASADADAGDCGSARTAATPELTRTSPTPAPDGGARASAGTSATARSDDTDADVPADGDADASTESDDSSARTTSRRPSSSGSGDRHRQDGSGGGSGGSGGGSAQNLDVPLPVPATVDVPSVGGLPGLRVGG